MWRKKPISISDLSQVDCLFSIDENGTSTLKNAGNMNNDNKLFTITGVLIEMEHFNDMRNDIVELKEKYWESGMYNGQRVILHAKDIRKKQGPFNPRIINYDEFINDLNDTLSGFPIKVYSANIDKKKHWAKYMTPYPVYELGVEFIIERFCFDMRKQNQNGIVLLESRGSKEDKLVLEKMKKLINNGNDFNDEENFEGINGVYFNPKYTSDYQKSYWPLEIADLISYRIHKYVKSGKSDEDFKYIEEKIFGYPFYLGKGLKIFPE